LATKGLAVIPSPGNRIYRNGVVFHGIGRAKFGRLKYLFKMKQRQHANKQLTLDDLF
jgi:hypothetical protein